MLIGAGGFFGAVARYLVDGWLSYGAAAPEASSQG
jgi:fluoride ion exporter CrcB/FEX